MKSPKFLQLCVLCFLFASVGCGNREPRVSSNEEIVNDSLPLLIDQIVKCSKLYATEYKVHKIITHDDQMKLQGKLLSKSFDVDLPFGVRKVAIPMDATLKGYIDFSTFTEKNIRRQRDKIEIILPDPRVEITSSTIDHDRIVSHIPILRSDFSDKELTDYEQQGRREIANSVLRMGITERARQNAANIIIPMLTQLGYKQNNITVTFRKTFTESDLNDIVIMEGPGK